LFLSAPRRKRVPAWVVAAGVATLFVGTYCYALSTGHWNTDLSDRLYFELIPHTNKFAHL
jgi:type VI protein secretion system component VasF